MGIFTLCFDRTTCCRREGRPPEAAICTVRLNLHSSTNFTLEFTSWIQYLHIVAESVSKRQDYLSTNPVGQSGLKWDFCFFFQPLFRLNFLSLSRHNTVYALVRLRHKKHFLWKIAGFDATTKIWKRLQMSFKISSGLTCLTALLAVITPPYPPPPDLKVSNLFAEMVPASIISWKLGWNVSLCQRFTQVYTALFYDY